MMKKVFWYFCMAATALFPMSSLAAPDNDPLGDVLTVEEPLQPEQLPEYWLGIQFRPGLPALTAQLHLPQHGGIVIEAVVPDSPAAKAGLAQYDVVLKADGNDISGVSELLKSVEAAKDKEMKLDIIRDGKPKTVAITPVKRPEDGGIPAQSPDSDIEALQKWMENMRSEFQFTGPNGPMRFQFVRPGVILPRGALAHPPLPGNMSISITKTGDKPADIVVKMDDDKWEVTEKDLDKLPEKVRPFVNSMLGMSMGAGVGGTRWMSEVIAPSPQSQGIGVPNSKGETSAGQVLPGSGTNIILPQMENRIERRMEEMRKHLEKLENELHQRRPDQKQPEPAPTPEKNKEPASDKALIK
jgi:hypothetical protein